jgi:hypothetical protein
MQTVKNIEEPIRAYEVKAQGEAASSGLKDISSPGDRKPLALPDKPSIAVLPFQNMSGDPEQEYFADGMVEEIITALSRNKQLFVIARNSSFTFKGKPVDIRGTKAVCVQRSRACEATGSLSPSRNAGMSTTRRLAAATSAFGAQNGHADRIPRCPVSGAKRKTVARVAA